MKRIYYFLAFLMLSSFLNAQFNANFTGSPVTGCAPLVVQFTDASTGSPTGWNWNFGNGNSSAVQHPTAVYSTPGTYNVTLIVSKAGQTDTEVKNAYIVVYNPPIAGFVMNNDTICAGQSITFTDSTAISAGGQPITTWTWDFGDGSTQTVSTSSVTHTYTTAGTFPVSLVAIDSKGCSGSKVKNVVVVASPVASFTATPRSACSAPLNVTFTNSSAATSAASYKWYFGDGTTSLLKNPTHNYTALGSYNVSLVVSQNGCKDSITLPAYIVMQTMAAGFTFSPVNACPGTNINFTNSSVPAAVSASWDFGDGSTAGSVSPGHIYTNPGTYTVTMIATGSGGCKDTIVQTVTIDPKPIVSFSADTLKACSLPFTVNFTSSTTNAAAYQWNFGGGNTSTQQHPVYAYNTTGTFNVSLTAMNAAGTCSTTVTLFSYIKIVLPTVSFSTNPDSGCVPLNVQFNASAVSTIESIVNWYWNYGDGFTDTSLVPSINHTYTAVGIYTPFLIAETAHGCRDTFYCNDCVRTGTKPTAAFSVSEDTMCYGRQVFFSDSSQNATGWLYQYGDGGSSTQPNPSYTYIDTGTYDVKLIAFNNGCADTSDLQTILILPPKAIIDFDLNCINYYSVQFNSVSHGADSLIWDFGDGTIDSSNSINPLHVFPSRGNKYVTLYAFNYTTGCADTVTRNFTIAEPIADFSPTAYTGCYPLSENFLNTSQDANSSFWNFGDSLTIADTSISANPAYVYALPSENIVELIITDVNGCKDSISKTILAFGPLPGFYADTLEGCKPFPVTFIDTSVSDSALVQWTWDFGDGTTGITSNDSLLHVYTAPGIYTVIMQVEDANGCVKSNTLVNLVQATFPFPGMVTDTFACRNDNLIFDATPTNAINPTYTWDFGDGQQSTDTVPQVFHTYANDGIYTLSLTVTDKNGCDSTITKQIYILKPDANFTYSVTSLACGSMNVQFADASSQYVTDWFWNFGDGGTSNSPDSTAHNYIAGGFYDVTLIVTNLGGCKDTITLDSLVNVPFPSGSFSFSPVSGCNPLTVNFAADAINTEYYVWDFGDGNVVQNGDSITHTYTAQGTFNPVLILADTLSNGNACLVPAVNISGTVDVQNVINISFNAPPVIIIPQDSTYNIAASISGGTAPYDFFWSPGTNLSCTNCLAAAATGLGDTITYFFNVTDSSGCVGIDSVLVIYLPCFEIENLPNIFSPNGDGLNDFFFVPGTCSVGEFSLEIYDRWGLSVYSSDNYKGKWDGKTKKGEDAPGGTYYLLLKSKEIEYKGFVQLIR